MFNAALNTIYDEHRSLAAVIQGLRFVVATYRADGCLPDFGLLREIVAYLDEFPGRLHHPKEEAYLFVRLQQATRDADAIIAELSAEHRTEVRLVADLAAALESFASGAKTGGDDFARAADRYSEAVLRHLAREESVLLPMARRQLSDEDWVEIGVAFGSNGDPRFDPEGADEFAALFRRIVNLGTTPNTGRRSAGQ